MPQIKLKKPRSGVRVGYHRIVEAVDQTRTDAYAFSGNFLPDDQVVDATAGALVIEKRPHGTEDRVEWCVGIVHADGWVEWSAYYSHDNFEQFRDRVARLLGYHDRRDNMELTIWKAELEDDDEIATLSPRPPDAHNNWGKGGRVHHEARHHQEWEDGKLGHIIAVIFPAELYRDYEALVLFRVMGESNFSKNNTRVLDVSEAIAIPNPGS